MRRPIVGTLIVLVALMFIACSSTPPYYHCNWEAEQLVKRRVDRPIEVHDGVGTMSQIKRLSIVDKWADEGYRIYSGVVFGVNNAYGKQDKFVAWYKARVDTDGDCNHIEVDHVAEWD